MIARPVAIAALFTTALAGCASAPRSGPSPPTAARADAQEGDATWYGRYHHGKPTASGEPFDMHALTAAHRTLPLGSLVDVENLRNGRRVRVRINDRGPYGSRRRIIDLSYEAARELGMIDAGVVPVRITVVTLGHRRQ